MVGLGMLILGVAGALLAVFLFWGSEPAFVEKQCLSARNTTQGFGAPPGTTSDTLEAHYKLFPLQIVCEWQKVDGSGAEATFISVGDWIPAASLVGILGGIVLIFASGKRQAASERALDAP